ncbi:MAG: hypothetical protein A4E52_00644 [Pelotomaculum sp. PtaB.Bin013]|uniref:YndM family protein n=1 Tax=Pelotomaculum isophthalicicum JI TaxID=947010 RepID=A0A9X4JT55_9FIRM|nr:DUF2512 family protein [Pelotomaculum isophthalicicum]MDF9406910.1 YndM family protein [Pelotomaculum isophthalicicum JI]OPX91037.1 MAG: hypothetical protein A4E52_00644 [Pelotomaculum sp. PtaB.Bin013]
MFKNKHFNAILTKFLLIITIFGLIMPVMGNITTLTAVIAAMVLTLAAYFIADLIVLPQYGNRLAVLSDVVITVVVAWEVVRSVEKVYLPVPGLIIIAVLVGLGEWYYHVRYLARLIYKGKIKP